LIKKAKLFFLYRVALAIENPEAISKLKLPLYSALEFSELAIVTPRTKRAI
jgi:hypothetical protein